MTDLNALADRVEKLTGPDREADAEIGVAVGKFFLLPDRGFGPRYGYRNEDGSEVHPGQAGDMLVPAFTASLDAAMTLVPDLHNWACGDLNENDLAWACTTSQQDIDYLGEGLTPARALVAAALRARAGADR